VDVIRLLRLVARGLDVPLLGKGLARALGLADEGALDTIRADVRDLMEQVAKLREREIALAGGVSQLRARAARFDEALAGLARVQGKYVARQDAHAARADDLERLTRRRDDHITRLIRDTVSQRAELERVSQQLGEARAEPTESPLPAAGMALNELIGKLQALESKVDDFRKLHKAGTQGVIDSLEGMRERIGRVEARVAEMSRESRAKGGRLDALARHVAGVESRMAMALGKGGKPVVAVASEIDKPLHAAG
jgi:chromosome segregation ATPase